MRAALVATAVFQIATKNVDGAVVAVEGTVVSLIPLLIGRLSQTRVPRPLEFAFVLGMALQFISESTKLFEVFTYWDKVVHPTLVAMTGMIGAWLLLGYGVAFGKHVTVHVAAAFGMLLGLSIGAFWEFVEFTTDWFANSDLQKSNGDTISDIMSNNIGAFVATLFGLWLFTRVMGEQERVDIGRIAWWLAHGPLALVRRHGRLLGATLTVLVAALVASALWIDRDVPALASGLTPGIEHTWALASAGSLPGDAQALTGDWLADPRGICRENLEHPRPGSEKMGLLQLGTGTVYGQSAFSVQARYFEERPPLGQGTEMDAGIAFGIRDGADFDLLEQNALHDVLRLDEFIHGRRRDLREKLYRTHGNEWHVMRLDVDGSTVTASVDGQLVYAVEGVPNTHGGIGLWARAAAATCFSDVSVQVSQ